MQTYYYIYVFVHLECKLINSNPLSLAILFMFCTFHLIKYAVVNNTPYLK
jgi:hypothetical protein